MTAFDDLVAAADAAVTNALGGPVTIFPRVPGRYGAADGDDPDRPIVSIEAVYGSSPRTQQPGQNFQVRVAGTLDALWVSGDQAARIPFDVMPGDMVELLVRGAKVSFFVTLVTDDDQGGLDILLSKEKPA